MPASIVTQPLATTPRIDPLTGLPIGTTPTAATAGIAAPVVATAAPTLLSTGAPATATTNTSGVPNPTAGGYAGNMANYALPADVQANVDWLMRPGSTYDVDQRAAESNFGRGTGGSAFGAQNTLQLRDADRLAKIEAGNKILEPYVQRYQAMELEKRQEAAQLAQIALQGENALRQISATGDITLANTRAQVAGQARIAAANNDAEAQRQIVAGKQALEQLTAQQGFTSQQDAMKFAQAVALQTQSSAAELARAQLQATSTADLARFNAGQEQIRQQNADAAALARAQLTETGANTRAAATTEQQRYATNVSLIDNILNKFGLGSSVTGTPATRGTGFQETIGNQVVYQSPDYTPNRPATPGTGLSGLNLQTLLSQLGLGNLGSTAAAAPSGLRR